MKQQTHDILLHLANTQEMYGEVMALLAEHRQRYNFTNALRDYVEEQVYDFGEMTPLQLEIMSTHLCEVEWNVVADDYFDEYNNIAEEIE